MIDEARRSELGRTFSESVRLTRQRISHVTHPMRGASFMSKRLFQLTVGILLLLPFVISFGQAPKVPNSSTALDDSTKFELVNAGTKWTGGPLKPGFGLSGAVRRLDKVLPPLFRLFATSESVSIRTSQPVA